MQRRRTGLLASGFLAVALLGAGCSSGPAVDLTPKSGYVVTGPMASSKGKTIQAGDRVRVTKRAGTFKTRDTRHPADINADAGRTGIALGGIARETTTLLGTVADPEPAIVLVRWDPQIWTETSEGQPEVEVGEFEATIHADYLEVVKK